MLFRSKTFHEVTEGGATRFHSVRNGLKLVPEGALVAIHDGVRPFVAASVIRDAFHGAARDGGVIPVVDVVDSVRQTTEEGDSFPIDRDCLKLVQTPQVFQSTLLHEAYRLPFDKSFTDDASVFEAAGYKIRTIPGNRENIKITTPFDLLIAEALIE